MATSPFLFCSQGVLFGMDREFLVHLKTMAQERDLPVDELIGEAEIALAAAYKKHVGATGEVTVRIDTEKAKLSAICEKEVVGVVTNHYFQIGIEEARKKKPGAEIGDFIPMEIPLEAFGRIAASTFKQVLQQKLREAERKRTMEEFEDRLYDVVSATVNRRDGRDVILTAGRSECVLPKKEQVPTEPYRINDRLRCYVLAVDEESRRGPRVIVSRTHPQLLVKLFEIEVPEIAAGTVEIRDVAREPGQRSKISVLSNDERIDPVGACVGQRGARVQQIVNELYDEKIDIILHTTEPVEYVTAALSPAKITKVTLDTKDEESRTARVIVPDSQLSLAIGKGGINVRLAAKLTGWKIDIRSETQVSEGTA
jgi:N utilization substance protein A